MAYQFKLEALRRFRQYQEERLQKELAEAVSRREHAAAELNAMVARRAETESELTRCQNESSAGASQFCIYVRYLQRLELEIGAHRKNLAGIEEEVDSRRDSLLEAVKKRKALEKLKEKGLKAYISGLDREEQKFINEIAINRFGAKTQ